MNRLCTILGILAAAVAVACTDSTSPPGPQSQTPYAVLYGHIGAPHPTVNITVVISAYGDSAQAIANGGAGYAGSFSQLADTGYNYVAIVPATTPGTYFLNVNATGQNKSGFVKSIDTVRALRVHFDSIGGSAPHDSIMVNDSLP